MIRRLMVPVLFATGLSAAPPERTLEVDAVELVTGRELAGQQELSVEHEGFVYHFASPENQAAFLASPQRYAVADGGACGRMGPLTGLGDARRFAVHDGRIFLFASDGCREGFLKDPARCIETADPRPTGSPEAVAAGAQRMNRLAAWAGGADRLTGMSTYRETRVWTQPSGEREYRREWTMAARFPDRFVTRDDWDEQWYARIRAPGGAAIASNDSREMLAAERGHAFDRLLGRRLVVLLREHVAGTAAGGAPALVAIADGEGEVDDHRVEYVQVWWRGALSRLALDADSGAPLQLSFRGRDRTASVGAVVRTYTRTAESDGLRLPTAYTVTLDGQEYPSVAAEIDRFEVNPDLADELFRLAP